MTPPSSTAERSAVDDVAIRLCIALGMNNSQLIPKGSWFKSAGGDFSNLSHVNYNLLIFHIRFLWC